MYETIGRMATLETTTRRVVARFDPGAATYFVAVADAGVVVFVVSVAGKATFRAQFYPLQRCGDRTTRPGAEPYVSASFENERLRDQPRKR